jgi:putative ABC transport system ATP-binding protein
MTNNHPVLQIIHLSKVYSSEGVMVHALRGIDITIHRGEMVAIMGHSGSGKSTLLNVLGCLDRPTEGTYLLDNTDTGKMTDDMLAHIRNKKIGFVFQSYNLLPRYTALTNVELPLMYGGVSFPERKKRAVELLHFVGLGHRMEHRPRQLSGGEQQRVAIARALANNPSIILGDEPTGNLDTSTSGEIMNLFSRLNKELEATVIIVTHEPDIAHLCQRIITLKDGKIKSDKLAVGLNAP